MEAMHVDPAVLSVIGGVLRCHGITLAGRLARKTASPDQSDLTLVISPSENNELITIPAHRVILACRSPFFHAMLTGPFQEAKEPRLDITEYLGGAPMNMAIEATTAALAFVYGTGAGSGTSLKTINKNAKISTEKSEKNEKKNELSLAAVPLAAVVLDAWLVRGFLDDPDITKLCQDGLDDSNASDLFLMSADLNVPAISRRAEQYLAARFFVSEIVKESVMRLPEQNRALIVARAEAQVKADSVARDRRAQARARRGYEIKENDEDFEDDHGYLF